MIATLAYGCFYYPMAILALCSFGGVIAALPHIVIPGIFRALPGYLLSVLAISAGLIATDFGQEWSKEIPYAGWFLPTAIGLYSFMFQARLIGLIYRSKQEKLGWE